MKLFQAVIMFGVLLHVLSCAGPPSIPSNLSNDTPYTLGPGDVIHISIWKDESLTRDVIVRPDGKFSFPLVGDISAQGLTVEELKHTLKNGLKRYIPRASVSVEVKQTSYKVFVIGKVNRPGEFLINQYTDVMQALSLAGGLTPYASESSIQVLRRTNGKQHVYPFSYRDILNGEDLERNIILQRGDVVMVP